MYEVQSSSGKSILQMEYDHNGTIITLNRGTRKQEQDQQDKGFVLCTACDRWLFGTERIAVHTEPDHAGRCPKNATPEDILHQVILFTEGRHDVMAFHIECPEGIEDVGAFYSTLMTALLQGIRLRFSLDESELDGFIRPTTDGIGFEIIIFESADGGIGALEALKENTRFEETIAKALELIHYNDDSGCNKACYECLLSYYNQPDHALIDRTLIVPILEMLQDVIISPFVVKPESSIQKLLASCDSNLEKDVLNQIYNSGIPIPDKGQHVIFDGKVPVAKLDFYYEKQTIAVFVDGPPHDKDYVMKDDEKKRARLKELGYRVHGIRYDSIKEDITKLSKLVHSNI